MRHATNANTRFSPLDQITSGNASQLRVAWTFSTGTDRGQEGAPLVVGDTLYIVTPYPNILYALDLTRPGAPMKWRRQGEYGHGMASGSRPLSGGRAERAIPPQDPPGHECRCMVCAGCCQGDCRCCPARVFAGTRDVADALRVLRFDGHKGQALYLDDAQRLVQPVYD